MGYLPHLSFVKASFDPFPECVKITRELKDVTVITGEDATFRCEVSHSGCTNVEWWLGSNALQNNDLNQISCRGREHSLELKMVTTDDSGDVAFVVGQERSIAYLMVQDKPKGKRTHDMLANYNLSVISRFCVAALILRNSNTRLRIALMLFALAIFHLRSKFFYFFICGLNVAFSCNKALVKFDNILFPYLILSSVVLIV